MERCMLDNSPRLDVNTLLRRQMELHTSIRHPPKTAEQLVQLRDTMHNYECFFTTTLPTLAHELHTTEVTLFQCLMYISNGGAVNFDRQHEDGLVPMHQAKVLSRTSAIDLESIVRQKIQPSELMVYTGISRDVRNTLRVKMEDENDLLTASKSIREAVEYLDYIYAQANKSKDVMFAFYMVEDESNLRRLLACNTMESVEAALIENTWRGLNVEEALCNAREGNFDEVNNSIDRLDKQHDNHVFSKYNKQHTNKFVNTTSKGDNKSNYKRHDNDIWDTVNGTNINEFVKTDVTNNSSSNRNNPYGISSRCSTEQTESNLQIPLPLPLLTCFMEEVSTKCEVIMSTQQPPLSRTQATTILTHWIEELGEDEFAEYAHDLVITMADALTALVAEKRSALCRAGCELIRVYVKRVSSLASFMAEVEQGSAVSYASQSSQLASARSSKRHSLLRTQPLLLPTVTNATLSNNTTSPLANAKTNTAFGATLSRWASSLMKGVYVTIAAIATATDRALRDVVMYSHGIYSVTRAILAALETGTQTELRRRCLGYLALSVVSATMPLREIVLHDEELRLHVNSSTTSAAISINRESLINMNNMKDSDNNDSACEYNKNDSNHFNHRRLHKSHPRRCRLQEPFIRRSITRIQHLITLITPIARQNVEVGDSPNRKMARALCVVLRECNKLILAIKFSLSVAGTSNSNNNGNNISSEEHYNHNNHNNNNNNNNSSSNNSIKNYEISEISPAHGIAPIFEPLSSKTEKLILQESTEVVAVVDNMHNLDVLLFERHDFISSTRSSYSNSNGYDSNVRMKNSKTRELLLSEERAKSSTASAEQVKSLAERTGKNVLFSELNASSLVPVRLQLSPSKEELTVQEEEELLSSSLLTSLLMAKEDKNDIAVQMSRNRIQEERTVEQEEGDNPLSTISQELRTTKLPNSSNSNSNSIDISLTTSLSRLLSMPLTQTSKAEKVCLENYLDHVNINTCKESKITTNNNNINDDNNKNHSFNTEYNNDAYVIQNAQSMMSPSLRSKIVTSK